MYNTLLLLSRNTFFYKKIQLPDSFETRIYLMLMHFSIFMIIFKKKGKKFQQNSYDSFFHHTENNLREIGLGDVSVNKKMKEFNKILYDILLKIEINSDDLFKINNNLIFKYFDELKDDKSDKYMYFEDYLLKFYKFCFELPLDNMIRGSIKFKI